MLKKITQYKSIKIDYKFKAIITISFLNTTFSIRSRSLQISTVNILGKRLSKFIMNKN